MNKGVSPAALMALLGGDLNNFAVAATPGGIEAQEAAGQAMFVANATLPKDMGRHTRADFEKLGFKFGKDADDLFVSVTMPTGWKKQATDHSMHSDILDDKGHKRAGVFYKAAFYDRSAHISLTRRFHVDGYVSVDERGEPMAYPSTHHAVAVMDCGQEIYRAGIYAARDYSTHDELEKKADAWLKERYPNANDPLAYWD